MTFAPIDTDGSDREFEQSLHRRVQRWVGGEGMLVIYFLISFFRLGTSKKRRKIMRIFLFDKSLL